MYEKEPYWPDLRTCQKGRRRKQKKNENGAKGNGTHLSTARNGLCVVKVRRNFKCFRREFKVKSPLFSAVATPGAPGCCSWGFYVTEADHAGPQMDGNQPPFTDGPMSINEYVVITRRTDGRLAKYQWHSCLQMIWQRAGRATSVKPAAAPPPRCVKGGGPLVLCWTTFSCSLQFRMMTTLGRFAQQFQDTPAAAARSPGRPILRHLCGRDLAHFEGPFSWASAS